jgi:hypothetical protein
MSASLIVATILVAGWNLTLVLTAFFTGTGPFRSEERTVRPMSRSLSHVRAEIGEPELDARPDAWKREGDVGTAEYAPSRITDTSQEVTVPVPYAEASVTVVGTDGPEARYCSICMN